MKRNGNEIPPHGGDIYANEIKEIPDLLDFSANISPLGLPESVKNALANRLTECENYPDPHSRELRKALSEKHGIHSERIVCGAGSADLIFRIARVFCGARSLVTAPTFSEYESALREAGSDVSYYPLSWPDFEIKRDILEMIPGKRIIFLCNPNNPTGVLTPKDMIAGIFKTCSKNESTLVIDECFMDLTDDPDSFTAEPLLKTNENLIILKAFTKNYAMAGLRLGYALCGSQETAKRISETGPPWSVSVPAQIAGTEALKDAAYINELRALIKTERAKIKAGLSDAGLEVIGGSANYVFFRTRGDFPEGANLTKELIGRGILIRDCSNYIGLEDGAYFRVAVRLPEENERLLREIWTILKHMQ